MHFPEKPLKEYATNKKKRVLYLRWVTQQKFDENRTTETIEPDISLFKYTNIAIFGLLESAAIVLGLFPVFVIVLPGVRESVSRM